MINVPISALGSGFSNDPAGTHTSRTLMLRELQALLASLPPSAEQSDYRAAAVDDNAILKATVAGRQKTFRHLRELYSLDRGVPIFSAMQELWDADSRARPLLALLCASARDPLLRASASTVLGVPTGGDITPAMLAQAVSREFPGRYSQGVLARIGRNAASSWQQSGHLKGRSVKVRSQPDIRPAATAYALLLGYLCYERGARLFETIWSRILDAPIHLLREQAIAASQVGWLEYRYAGSVTDISFRHLLRQEEQHP